MTTDKADAEEFSEVVLEHVKDLLEYFQENHYTKEAVASILTFCLIKHLYNINDGQMAAETADYLNESFQHMFTTYYRPPEFGMVTRH